MAGSTTDIRFSTSPHRELTPTIINIKTSRTDADYWWDIVTTQADVCHAYQIVHAHGVPDDHIIVMWVIIITLMTRMRMTPAQKHSQWSNFFQDVRWHCIQQRKPNTRSWEILWLCDISSLFNNIILIMIFHFIVITKLFNVHRGKSTRVCRQMQKNYHHQFPITIVNVQLQSWSWSLSLGNITTGF